MATSRGHELRLKLRPAVCADTTHRQMRRDRRLLLNHKAQADQFDRDCGGQAAR
jgi:hypothetical protein